MGCANRKDPLTNLDIVWDEKCVSFPVISFDLREDFKHYDSNWYLSLPFFTRYEDDSREFDILMDDEHLEWNLKRWEELKSHPLIEISPDLKMEDLFHPSSWPESKENSRYPQFGELRISYHEVEAYLTTVTFSESTYRVIAQSQSEDLLNGENGKSFKRDVEYDPLDSSLVLVVDDKDLGKSSERRALFGETIFEEIGRNIYSSESENQRFNVREFGDTFSLEISLFLRSSSSDIFLRESQSDRWLHEWNSTVLFLMALTTRNLTVDPLVELHSGQINTKLNDSLRFAKEYGRYALIEARNSLTDDCDPEYLTEIQDVLEDLKDAESSFQSALKDYEKLLKNTLKSTY